MPIELVLHIYKGPTEAIAASLCSRFGSKTVQGHTAGLFESQIVHKQLNNPATAALPHAVVPRLQSAAEVGMQVNTSVSTRSAACVQIRCHL